MTSATNCQEVSGAKCEVAVYSCNVAVNSAQLVKRNEVYGISKQPDIHFPSIMQIKGRGSHVGNFNSIMFQNVSLKMMLNLAQKYSAESQTKISHQLFQGHYNRSISSAAFFFFFSELIKCLKIENQISTFQWTLLNMSENSSIFLKTFR